MITTHPAPANRPITVCGAFRETDGGRVFVCVAKEHTDDPDQHYFSLDSEATVDRNIPSNAGLESNIETYFRNEVRKMGGVAIKLIPTSKGLPDRMVLFPGGKVYFIELKAVGGRPSAAQLLWHEKMRGLGHNIEVLVGKAQVKDWLAIITEEAGPKFRKRDLLD